MAIPNYNDTKGMDYAYNGAPFVDVPAKSGIDTKTLDYAYLGAPFVAADYPSSSSSFVNIYGYILD